MQKVGGLKKIIVNKKTNLYRNLSFYEKYGQYGRVKKSWVSPNSTYGA